MIEKAGAKLSQVINSIKRHCKLIAVITILITAISAVISSYISTPVYESNTKLFIGKGSSNEEYNYNELTMYKKLLSTYSETIKTRDLVERALKTVDVNLTATEVLEDLKVTAVEDSQIINISYSNVNPWISANVLNAISDEFIITSKNMISNWNIQIIESVETPKSPSNSNRKINIVIGFILGIIIGLGVALLKEYFDKTYKNKEQIEKELGIPVIGSIPFSKEV